MPSINISEQFESILVTILQQISILPFEMMVMNAWSGYFVGVVESSCLPTHNVAQHISSHDLP